MHVIYDNLIAILISGFLLTLIVQLTRDSNENRLDTTRYYASRVQSAAFIETIQRDFRNLGAGVDAAQPMITGFTWDNTQKTFEFKAALNPAVPTQVDEIKYELNEVPSAENVCPSTCYELKRYVKKSGSYVHDGGSMASIAEFAIVLRDGGGTVLPVGANLDDTREIEVRMAALSPFGEDRIIKRTRWQTRFKPVNLIRKDP